MDKVVIDQIPFDPDLQELAEWLSLRPGSARMVALREMVDRARSIARPKVVYRVFLVDDRGDDYIVLEGTRFTSRVLSVNLDAAHRAFVYVATCGVELDDWVQSVEAPLEKYQADFIAGAALSTARHAFFDHVEQVFHPGRLGEMNPGSLPDWPLREQRPLFQLLGDPEAAIGVQLLDSGWMTPTQSTSGLLFPAEDGYYNCQLCPMAKCPGRQAPYEPELYDHKYRSGEEPPPGDRPASATRRPISV
jgi:hypothetical protein